MKRHIIPCILSLTLLLTACGGEQAAADTAEEAVKDHYYQILDAAGKELYTVTDSGAVAEIDALINKAGGENADHGNAEGDPLYTYVYWQETTLHAGEDPDAEREYLEDLPDPGAAGQQLPSPRRSCPIPWRALGAL